MIRSWFTEGMIAEIKAYKEANTIMESDLVALRAQAVASAAETEAAASEVAARTTELALRVLQSPKLKADAERLEKASAELSKEAAKWRGEAACGNDAKRAQEAELGDPSTRREGKMGAADDNTRSEVAGAGSGVCSV